MTREELLKIAKPILFNTEMVKAILNGRKTVTRRLINWDIVNRCDMEKDGTLLCFEDEYGDHIRPEKLCRYKPGNILYVRETWCELSSGYEYKADGETIDHLGNVMKWHPSIHMPKEAARIFLKVTDVRVERLQNMDCEDAMKEGIDSRLCVNLKHTVVKFMKLWNSTIKKSNLDKYGWDANPYVWVIEFERIEVKH